MAALAGGLVGLSRQVNGRLALARGALGASFWNHAVGLRGAGRARRSRCGSLTGRGAASPPRSPGAPLWAWAGGPIGVLFVAAGSWLIARIGAANTALLVIAGQMVSGALLDALRGAEGAGGAGARGRGDPRRRRRWRGAGGASPSGITSTACSPFWPPPATRRMPLTGVTSA